MTHRLRIATVEGSPSSRVHKGTSEDYVLVTKLRLRRMWGRRCGVFIVRECLTRVER